MRLMSRWTLPLLAKELLEQAARRRTYIVRVLYVGLFSLLALTVIQRQGLTANWWGLLGQGQPILISLVHWQFIGIHAFLPAMACGVFTTEKERNTLGLLFLTRLGPWTMVTEKLLSRMFPMLMFLCCALPVMAFTYAIGGITVFDLFCGAWFLSLSVLQVTAIAVMCSAWTHATTTAFFQTYFVLFCFRFGPSILAAIIPGTYLGQVGIFLASWQPPSNNRVYSAVMSDPNLLLLQLSVPSFGFDGFVNQWSKWVAPPWLLAVIMGLPSILGSLACLAIARLCLFRRAFIQPFNPLLKLFRRLDRFFVWANHRYARDVTLIRESSLLPDQDPIAWREVTKRALGQVRYLVRILIPMMFPVVFVGLFVASASANDWSTNSNASMSPLVLLLWCISLVLIVVMAANTVPLERTRQSWDVLRVLPLTARDILLQKLSGVRRLQWVSSIPVLSAIAIEAWWRKQLFVTAQGQYGAGSLFNGYSYRWWEYLFGAVTSVWVYGELAKWTSLWWGLMVRSPMRAVTASLLTVAAMSVVPFCIVSFLVVVVILSIIPEFHFLHVRGILFSICPYVFISANEFRNLRELIETPLVPAIINLVWHGSLLLLLRRHMLRRAEWYLGRIGSRGRSVGQSGRVSSEEALADAGSVRHVADAGSIRDPHVMGVTS